MGIKRQNTIKSEGAMSSMSDIVFLLLIFFIILSTMANTVIPVTMPKSGSTSPEASDRAALTVTYENSIVRVYVNKREFTYVNRETNEIDAKELTAALLAVMKEDHVVELKADETVPYVWPAQIISIVKQNKWTLVLGFRTN